MRSRSEELSPAYGVRSLGEVLPSVCAAAGGGSFTNHLDLPPVSSYVVFLIDGLGWSLLRAHRGDAPYLASLLDEREPITSGVPSTTATSITSFGTGLPPGRHGLVGYTSRIPGTDDLMDALKWDKRVDPVDYQPHPSLFARGCASGLDMTVVARRVFERSGLTIASQRGGAFVGADSVGERIAAAVRSARSTRSVTYLYDGELDATGHRSGCESWAWRHELATVDAFAQRLRSALPSQTALVVTADHGMVDIAASDRLHIDDEPDLVSGVRLVGGEARFRHLYCVNGAVDDVRTRWAERLGGRAVVLTRDEAAERGWFGEVEPRVATRIGDVVVASLADCAIVSASRFPHEAKLIGLHGSVTAEEMLIPLLVDAAA